MKTKEKILKEFEDKYCSFELCNQVSKPELDKLKDFLSKAIAQTREETIREVIDKVRRHYDDLSILDFIEDEERKLNKNNK